MISVLNRLLRSSGSSLLIITCLLYVACSPTTSSTARTSVIKKDDPKTSAPTVEVIEVDTIQWTWADEEVYPPITSVESEVASFALDNVTKDRYEIALLLPMRLQQNVPNLDRNNKKFADFYAGLKMAAAVPSDLNASITVYYTNRDQSKLDEILSSWSFRKPDVIIASYERDLIKKTADFGLEHRIPVISPWLSSTSIAEDNLFYLQMRPSIDEYYKAILDQLEGNFEHDEVRIIQRADGSDKAKSMVLQRLQEEKSDVPIVSPYETLDIVIDSLMDAEANVFDTTLVQGVKAFVLPNYSSRDDRYVYTTLRKMYGEKLGRDFTVFTMPIAIRSDRVDINILKNLDIRTPDFRFPDMQNPKVQEFRKSYLAEQGRLPTEDAFYGYDMMLMLAHGLANYGQYFHYFMAGEQLELLQMKVHISPFYKEEDQERPNYMANDHLYIIEYIRDHFELSDRL